MEEIRKVVELSVDDILPNRFQPRIKFNETAINELAESIKEHGVIQPIVVRPISDKYEIIAGERRYKASLMAGKATIPAIITDLNDKQSAEVALIENVQREDLTPIEEAVSYKKILDMGYLTQEILAEKLGKKQSTIANKLRLLNLDEEVQEALLEEKISERHARSLLRLSASEQINTLNRIVNERLTVRKADEIIQNILNAKNSKKEEIPAEIEELDISGIKMEAEKEREVSVMNEEPSKMEYNMPVTPIVEEIEEVVPVGPVVVEETNQVSTPLATAVETSNFDNIEEIAPVMEPISNMANPGFMDIDAIEKTAVDINPEKPTADFDLLLNGKPHVVTQEEQDDEEDGAEELLKPGKFFDINAESEEHVEEDNNANNIFTFNPITALPDMESKPANMEFGAEPSHVDKSNFNFDRFFQTNTPIEPVQNNMEVPVPPISIESTTNMNNKVEPTIENKEEIPLNVESTQIGNDSQLFGNFFQTIPAEEPVVTVLKETEPVIPIHTGEEPIIVQNTNPAVIKTENEVSIVEPVIPVNVEPEEKANLLDSQLMPNMEPKPTNTFFNFGAFDIPAEQETNTNIVEQVEPSELKEEPILMQSQANISEMPQAEVVSPIQMNSEPTISLADANLSQSELVMNTDSGLVNLSDVFEPTPAPIIENKPFVSGAGIGTSFPTPDSTYENDYEPVIIDETPKGTNAYVAGNLKTVINTIRECAATIEKYGYIVETEELDFEDSYEVTFKIEKNN